MSVTHATFSIERTYDAPPSRVFTAFADRKAKEQRFGGPEEWGPDEHEMDFRVGGRETSVGGPKGGPVHAFACTYHDIVENERIVYTYDMHLDGALLSVSTATIEFAPDSAGTRLVLTEMGAFLDDIDTVESREHGTRELLDGLGRALKEMA